jgi:hypothetical protein
MEFNFLLGVKVTHLVDRTDLFSLVEDAVVTDLYSSLERQTAWENCREIERQKTSRRREIMLHSTALEQR